MINDHYEKELTFDAIDFDEKSLSFKASENATLGKLRSANDIRKDKRYNQIIEIKSHRLAKVCKEK